MKTKGKGRGVKKNHVIRKRTTFKRAYLTKAQAARKLQISNAEFERLVIMKGIFPREPKRFTGSGGKDKTYYAAKDVAWLDREPMLEKMRDFSTFKKKLARLKGRRENFDAKVFEDTHKPQYNLAPIIKERYPTFADALRDCDDALSHIFLYAALPPRVHSESTIEGHTYLTSAMADQCKEIRARWMKYIEATKGVRRVFISIKGIYYQANVKGEKITWQCPYEFTSKPPKDVIYRVMITFLEFYLQQMRFILFKLEHDLRAAQEAEAVEAEDDEELKDAENFPLSDKQAAARGKREKLERLLKGKVFYVSREVPQLHLRFLIQTFGGKVIDNKDAKGLTHYVIDRPAVPPGETQRVGVDYVQPQWLFDSINAKGLLPVDEYLMGKSLPPHISPFRISISNDPEELAELQEMVKENRDIKLDDVPDRVHEIRRMLDPSYNKANPVADVALSDEDDDEIDDRDREAAQLEVDKMEEESVESDDEEEEERVKEHIERSKQSRARLVKQLEKGDNKPTEKSAAVLRRERLQKLREERSKESVAERKRRRLEETQQEEQVAKEMKTAVMQPKLRKLYNAMQKGIKKRKGELDELEQRREKIREGKAQYDKKTKTLKIEQ